MLSTWAQDVTVLSEVVDLLERGVRPEIPYLSTSDLDSNQVIASMRRLSKAAPPFLEGHMVDQADYFIQVTGVTERGLRAVGMWPSPEGLVEQMQHVIESLADQAPTQEDRGALRKVLAFLGGAGRDLTVSVASDVVTKTTLGL